MDQQWKGIDKAVWIHDGLNVKWQLFLVIRLTIWILIILWETCALGFLKSMK